MNSLRKGVSEWNSIVCSGDETTEESKKSKKF